MIRALLRFLLIRVLPRRLVPILTAVEVFRLVRRLRTRRRATNPPPDATPTTPTTPSTPTTTGPTTTP